MLSLDKQYKTRDGRPARVICIGKVGTPYPVVALATKLVNGVPMEIEHHYTPEGKYWDDGALDTRDLVEISEYEDFKVDDLVMVRDYDCVDWIHAYFAGVGEDGLPQTWADGATSWTATNLSARYRKTSWNFCLKPTAEELENKSN